MIPIDKERCQAEKPNGAIAFSLGGVPKMIRCENKPTVIITETQVGSDGVKGSMCLCDNCLEVAKKQLPLGFFDEVRM